MEIELLANHAESIPTLAEYYMAEWKPYYGVDGPGDAQADLESRLNRDALPIGLIATDDGKVCGTAALDLDVATGLTPSIVGLLVLPAQRGRGVAKALIESAESLAKRLGYDRLYISTTLLGDLLVRMGWNLLGDVEFLNAEQGSIFERKI